MVPMVSLTLDVPSVVIECSNTRGVVPHQSMEIALGVCALCFLIDDLAVLWYRIDQDIRTGGINGLLQDRTIGVLPGLAIIVRVCEIEIMVRYRVWCLAGSPRSVKQIRL